MFESIYSSTVTISEFGLMALSALASGLVFAWIISFRVRSTRRFFVVSALLPFIVGAVITFVNGNIGAGVAVGGAFGLIRFRSAQGSADELAAVLIAMAAGIAFGMGYLFYGICLLLGLAVVYFLIAALPIFEHKTLTEERLLRITIPETLEYYDAFDSVFTRYLAQYENVGVKTTGMGSMYRLSFKIRMKKPGEEKAFIDELRVRNGNLEIALLPYPHDVGQL